MLARLSCGALAVAWAVVAGGCAAIAPNSGLPVPRWLAVNGPIAGDARALPLPMDDDKVWRAVRPSSSEQGLAQSNWEASYVVLVPAERVDGRPGEGPFSEAVGAALAACAPDLGSFGDQAEWAVRSQDLFRTGKVRIAGAPHYQYVVHRVTWSVLVSDTGRGHRLSGLAVQSFGSFSDLPRSRVLKETVRIAYGAPEHVPDLPSAVVVERADPAAVKASCNGGTLIIQGTNASASAGPWFNGILKQPFNVHIELREEVLP